MSNKTIKQNDKVSLNIKIERQLKNELRRLALKMDRPKAGIVRLALNKYIKEYYPNAYYPLTRETVNHLKTLLEIMHLSLGGVDPDTADVINFAHKRTDENLDMEYINIIKKVGSAFTRYILTYHSFGTSSKVFVSLFEELRKATISKKNFDKFLYKYGALDEEERNVIAFGEDDRLQQCMDLNQSFLIMSITEVLIGKTFTKLENSQNWNEPISILQSSLIPEGLLAHGRYGNTEWDSFLYTEAYKTGALIMSLLIDDYSGYIESKHLVVLVKEVILKGITNVNKLNDMLKNYTTYSKKPHIVDEQYFTLAHDSLILGALDVIQLVKYESNYQTVLRDHLGEILEDK